MLLMVSDTVDQINSALSTWYDNLNKLIEVIGTSPTSLTRVGSIITNVLTRVTIPVGTALVVLFFYIGALGTSATMAEAKRPEAAASLLIRTFISGTLVAKGYSFMSKLLEVFQGLITDFSSAYPLATQSMSKMPQDIVDAVNDMTFFNGIGAWIVSFIGSLAIVVISSIILLTAYGRLFKIYMYIIISPIPLSTFAAKSTQQVGIQFIKNFCSVCLEGIIMVLAIWIYGYMQQDTSIVMSVASSYDPTGSANAMVWSYLEVTIFNMLILMTIIKTSNALAKEMFGV